MGSYDGAEICELVGIYILDRLLKIHAKCDVGLYRGDGLVVVRNAIGRMADRTGKDFTRIFKDIEPKITAEANMKVVNFLDNTFNPSTGLYLTKEPKNVKGKETLHGAIRRSQRV